MARGRGTETESLVGRILQNLSGGVSQQPHYVRLPSQGEEQVNCWSRVVDGVSRRPPTEWVASLLSGAVPQGGWKVHIYDRDGTNKYIILIGDNQIKVYTFDGVACTITDTSSGYLNIDAATYTARDAFKAVTVADTTWVTNTTKTTAMSGVTTTARPFEFLVWAKTITQSKNSSIKVGTTDVDFATTANDGGATIDSIQTALTGAGLAGSWSFTRVGRNTAGRSSILHAIQNSGTPPADEVTISTGTSSDDIKVFFKRAQRFSDLPPEAPDGFVMEIGGADGDEGGNYWVKFDTSKHAWVETVEPGLDNTFDVDTLPHVLVRTGATTFDFKPYTWATREKGDATSAPEPSFIGTTIRDLVYHKDRLIVLADESVIATEAGFYDNFWPTTVTTVPDSDPFESTGSGNRVTFLDYAVPFQGELTLFSSRGAIQQELRGVDGVLTPGNANIVHMSEYESSPYVNPVGAGSSLFFIQDRSSSSGVFEYETDTQHAFAAEVTAHLPSYIPARIRHFEASTNEQMLCLVPETQSSTIYVYSFHWQDKRTKAQSAWSKWELSEATNILGMRWIGSSLYLVCYRANGPLIFLQKIDMRKLQDGDMGYRVYLDGIKSITGSYDAVNDVTNWTLPYGADSDETYFAILGDDTWETKQGKSVPLTVNPGNAVVFATGDFSAYPALVGHSYESAYTFSPAALEVTDGIAVSALGRLYVRTWMISYVNSGYFKVVQTDRSEDNLDDADKSINYTDFFTGRQIGGMAGVLGRPVLTDGVFQTGANGEAKNVRLTVSSGTSYLPFTLSAAEWEGYYYQRSRTV